MADVFRISVILAIVYLARFILAHESQTEEDRLYFADFQRGESSSAIEDSNDNIQIQSEESFGGETTFQRVRSEEDGRDVESNEEVQIQPDDSFRGSQTAWFEEEQLAESNEDNMSDEKVPIKSEIPLRRRAARSKEENYAKSDEYNLSNENMLIKSGAPLRGETVHHAACSEEDEIGELNENNPSNEKVLVKTGVPLRGRSSHHKAWSEEDKIVELIQDNPSKEKVLIQSGAPLRGRKIHHTAWSEEEKIVDSKEDATKENVKKSIYDAWSLKKAFNYLLSFIYDVEEDRAQTAAEDTKQYLKSPTEDLPEIVLPPQNILDKRKKMYGNLSTYNQDRDTFRENIASSLSSYFQNQDVKWLESEGGEFDNGDEYVDFEFLEALFEDKDFDQEDEFLNLFGDGERVGALQENPRKNIGPNLFKFQKKSENENMPIVKDKEHVQSTQESKVIEKEAKVQETKKEAVVVNKPSHSIEKTAAEEQSKVNVNPSINSNEKSKGDAADNFALIEDKKSKGDIFSQVEDQNGEVSTPDKNSSKLKLSENDPEVNSETTESIGELESYTSYATPVNYDKTEFSQDKQEKSNFHTASNNINNKSKETAHFDVESSIKTTATKRPQPSLPSTESTHNTNSRMGKDMFVKTVTQNPSTQHQLQPESSTMVPKNLNQHKEQSFNFDQQYQKNIIQSPMESNQERNNQVKSKHTIAQTKNEASQISPNGVGDTVVITDKSNSKRNKEANAAQFQNVQSPKENAAEHSKSQTNALKDLYPDFEVEENVASYNYVLDSGEFIRVDGNGRNKVNKKQNSILIPVKNEEHAASGKIKPILSEPTSAPIKDQSKPENFETILEYLYKYSNSTLLLALREYNSSES